MAGGVGQYNAVVRVKKIIPGQKVTGEKLERAKTLRREMTRAEALLWNELRAHRLDVHFRRQQIIAGYIVDFYCHAAGLVIEVDGEVHATVDQEAADLKKDSVLREMGLQVVRVRNTEVEVALATVLARIREHLDQ